MKTLWKYGYVIFLFNTVLYSIDYDIISNKIAPFIFYLIMGLYFLFLLINPKKAIEVFFQRSFISLLFINCINFLYYIFFDGLSDLDSLRYSASRFMQFSLILFAVYSNFSYFRSRFFYHLFLILIIITFLGLFVSGDLLSGQFRYTGILWNANMLSSLVGLCFSMLLLDKDRLLTGKRIYIRLLLMVFLFIILLSTESRMGVGTIVLSFIFRYGLSFRNIIYSILVFISLIFLQHRLINSDTLEREPQWQAAIISISEEPFLGYGLAHYNGYYERYFEGVHGGAHNAYLSILMQYGLIFGSIILFIILRWSFSLISYFYRSSEFYIKICVFIIVLTLISSFFETYITGINEFQTILFWFSLSFLSLLRHKNSLSHED